MSPADYRHFELQDLLSAALIALEGRRWADADAAVRRALAWVEADWLASPAGGGPPGVPVPAPPAAPDDEDD